MTRSMLSAAGGVAYSLLQLTTPARASLLGSLLFPAQQLVVPFDAGRRGSSVITDYHASRDATFWFYLNLKFAEEDPTARERVSKLAGSGETWNGKRIDNGVPIPVRLKITRSMSQSSEIIYDQVVPDEELEGFSRNYFSKIIAAVYLKRGDYSIIIEALQDVTQISGVPIDFDIHIPGNLK
jgi:hypothetical protein